MLYLAEIKKQTKAFITGKLMTELKLLARQNNDQTWSNTPNDEPMVAEGIELLGDGVLVMVNLNNQRQIQGDVELAGIKLIQQLQRLSRLLEKSKEQQEEIERWKSSLELQSRAIADKEAELESYGEQLEYLEQKYQKIEHERLELEQQWESLRQEQEQLQQYGFNLGNAQQNNGQNYNKIQALLTRLNVQDNYSESLWEELPKAFKVIEEGQKNLNLHFVELEQKRRESQEVSSVIIQQEELLVAEREEFEITNAKIEQIKLQWQLQKTLLMTKQEIFGRLNFHLQSLEEAQDTLTYAMADSGLVLPETVQTTVEKERLENIPLEELQEIVDNLEEELKNLVDFVKDQEDELLGQSETVEELHQQLISANEIEKAGIEERIIEEQNGKRMLEDTLVGQRRDLRERRYVLIQHLSILRQRQGLSGNERINLEPVIRQLIKRQNNAKTYWQRIEQDINHLTQTTEDLKNRYLLYISEREIKKQEIKKLEDAWEQIKTQLHSLNARVKLYEQILQPMQDNLNGIRHKLDSLNQWLGVN